MMLLRPVRLGDLPALHHIAKLSGPGFTSLPDDINALKQKTKHAIASFKRTVHTPADECYLFVLEDTHTGEVVATTGIVATTGLRSPLYHLRKTKLALRCNDAALTNKFESLLLTTDCSGTTEVCSLFLHPDYRVGNNGRFLSRSRFLFMAQQPTRFSKRIIAEMRGVSCANGHSPFWDWMRAHFCDIPFADAALRVGLGDTAFVPQIMPRHPLPLSCLSESARGVVGTVHPDTSPARRLLEKEGFSFRGCVDVFDAGPTLEADRDSIHTVSTSKLATVCIANVKKHQAIMIANGSAADFRATFTEYAQWDQAASQIALSPAVAEMLNVMDGDQVRCATL